MSSRLKVLLLDGRIVHVNCRIPVGDCPADMEQLSNQNKGQVQNAMEDLLRLRQTCRVRMPVPQTRRLCCCSTAHRIYIVVRF